MVAGPPSLRYRRAPASRRLPGQRRVGAAGGDSRERRTAASQRARQPAEGAGRWADGQYGVDGAGQAVCDGRPGSNDSSSSSSSSAAAAQHHRTATQRNATHSRQQRKTLQLNERSMRCPMPCTSPAAWCPWRVALADHRPHCTARSATSHGLPAGLSLLSLLLLRRRGRLTLGAWSQHRENGRGPPVQQQPCPLPVFLSCPNAPASLASSACAQARRGA